MIQITATEAERQAVLSTLRVARIKLARLSRECEVELADVFRRALADLDRSIDRLSRSG